MEQKKIIVLGVGLVGKSISIPLSEVYDVSCADIQLCSLAALSPEYPVTAIPCNFKDVASLRELIRPYDLVVNAVNSSIGYTTLKAIIEERKDAINLSLFQEDVTQLVELAERNDVTVVMCAASASELPDKVVSLADQFFSGKLSAKGIIQFEKELAIH
jgi:saccharopine dehydrogenase-like NADP-dependent oxidoreductase